MIESRPNLYCDSWTDDVVCFGKEPIARNHFVDVNPDFPIE